MINWDAIKSLVCVRTDVKTVVGARNVIKMYDFSKAFFRFFKFVLCSVPIAIVLVEIWFAINFEGTVLKVVHPTTTACCAIYDVSRNKFCWSLRLLYVCVGSNACSGGCQDDGTCTSCDAGVTGRFCAEPWYIWFPIAIFVSVSASSTNCDNPATSGTPAYRCDQWTQECESCERGFYGFTCHLACPGCTAGCDKVRFFLCCSFALTRCQTTGSCNNNLVRSGFYGEFGLPCPENCSGRCDRTSGNCSGCQKFELTDHTTVCSLRR